MKKKRGKAKRTGFKFGAHQAPSRAVVTIAPCPWDMGAMGPANRIGLVEEAATDITPEGETPNPNGVRRARRVDMLEVWHGRWVRQHKVPNTDRLMPYITTRQYNAAVLLRNAFEATARAPGWPDNDRVQSSPKPDHAVTIQIDRLSRFHAIARHIAASDRAILDWCVLQGRMPKGVGDALSAGQAHLREALDRLADGLEKR